MTTTPDWWQRPRKISVLVDNDSWILPFAEGFVGQANANGDNAALCREQEEIADGSVAFMLGCTQILPPEILLRNHRNLVVHASDLPRGRGFSPWTWLILEGETSVPVCLINASEHVDAGEVIYRDILQFEGHELVDELRHQLGESTVRLCLRFLSERTPPLGVPQQGVSSTFRRRRPADSEIDPNKPLAEQFDLLRTVDNVRYPAFFRHRGQAYKLTIEKIPTKQNPEGSNN